MCGKPGVYTPQSFPKNMFMIQIINEIINQPLSVPIVKEAGDIPIFIENVNGKKTTIHVTSSYTIMDLKKKIEMVKGILIKN